MKKRQFITGCACCALLGAGAVLYKKDDILSNFSDDGFVMNHIEVHIAEHCNLNCKYCCHFSCIAEKEFYDLDKFKQDMTRMSSLFNKQLLDLQILGGEPLLNPQINEYIKHSRQSFPRTLISIITNATLLDEMSEDFWKTLNENNVNIVPSIYPVKINWKSILDKAKKYNVGIYGNFDRNELLTSDNIDKFRKKAFSKMKLNIKGYEGTNERIGVNGIDLKVCKKRIGCNSMYDGKLYPCFIIAYIRHLNKKFNTDFVVSEKDYLDLYKIKSSKEVEEFLNTPTFPFCNYCIVNSGDVEWENSKEHALKEWT